MNVTKHGGKRSRERVGITKKAVDRNARLALERGLTHGEVGGALKRYLDWLFFKGNGEANNMRVYGDHIYIFHDETLITVLNVPPAHRKQAARLQGKRGGCDG